jgi:hypothetical protein
MPICGAMGKLVLYVLFGICVWYTYLMTLSLAQNNELRMVWLLMQSVLDRASSPTGILWRNWKELRKPYDNMMSHDRIMTTEPPEYKAGVLSI